MANNQIMKILKFQSIVQKIMKIIEFQWRLIKIMKIIEFLPFENHKNNENPKLLYENQENHENQIYRKRNIKS